MTAEQSELSFGLRERVDSACSVFLSRFMWTSAAFSVAKEGAGEMDRGLKVVLNMGLRESHRAEG
ncbi:MAG: hypothetical protein Cons2KO_30090 [Congregibacter sp.]